MSPPRERGDWWMFHHDVQHTGRSPFTGPAIPQLKWKYATGSAIYSSPALGADGTIYVGSVDDNLYALTPSGSLKWKYTTGSMIDSSPALGADGTIYVGSWDDNLYALTDNAERLAEVEICHRRLRSIPLRRSGRMARSTWDQMMTTSMR